MTDAGHRDSELVLIEFESEAAAEQALSTVRSLDAEGFLSLEEAAVITDDDVVEAAQDSGGPGKKTIGGVLGLVAGGVVGLPVLGILAGAGLASKKEEHADRIASMVDRARTKSTPGSATLALLVQSLNDPEIVVDRLGTHRDSVVRTEVPAELQAQIDRAQSSEGGSDG